MMSISKLSAGAVASKYYHEEGYYSDKDGEAKDQSSWHGKGAEGAELRGPVDDDVFQALLAGQAPNGQDLAAAITNGTERRMGYDLTFSAPKDVSVIGLVGEDKAVLAVHDAAVKTTLDHIEQNGIKARVYNPEMKDSERVTGQKAFFAVFRHDTSRSLDPQLHSHAIVVNMVLGEDGKYRAIVSEEFFANQKLYDAIYKNELSKGLTELGYSVRREGEHGDIRINGLPADIAKGFSKRSAEIQEKMEGSTDTNKSAAAARAALATRASKAKDVDRAEVLAAWKAEVKELGHDLSVLDKIKDQAKEQGRDVLRATRAQADDRPMQTAARLVGQSIAHHSEKDAVYSKGSLITFALNRSEGGIGLEAIEREVTQRFKDDRLFTAVTKEMPDGITDIRTVARERTMVGEMQKGFDASTATLHSLTRWAKNAERVVDRALKGSTLTPGQRDATKLIIASTDRVVGVQGFAGTGKTYMLERAQSLANRQGFKMEAIGPSAKSVEALLDAKMDAVTVARFLIEASSKGMGNKSDRILVVDEASMVDTQNMVELLRVANKAGYNRVVLMGDTAQLASVGAGAAFKQLQDAGMKMAEMTEINRQKNPELLDAVYAATRKDVAAAFNKIGNNVTAVIDGEYVKATADTYLALSPEQRANTGVIAQSNKARVAANTLIRDGLIEEGQVALQGVTKDHYSSVDMSTALKRDGTAYEVGDRVIAMAPIPQARLEQGQEFVVTGADKRTGRLIVRDADNKERTLDVTQKAVAERLGVYALEAREYASGDDVIFRSNDKRAGVINGERGTVTEATKDDLTVTKADGSQVKLDASMLGQKTMDHAYAATAHAFQGDTVDRILVAMGSKEALTNMASFYVGISRARHEAKLFTDKPFELAESIEKKTGESIPALHALERDNAIGKDATAPLERSVDPAEPDIAKATETAPDRDTERPTNATTSEREITSDVAQNYAAEIAAMQADINAEINAYEKAQNQEDTDAMKGREFNAPNTTDRNRDLTKDGPDKDPQTDATTDPADRVTEREMRHDVGEEKADKHTDKEEVEIER